MHTILDRREALSMLAAGAAAPLLPTILPTGVFGREAEHARYKSPYHLAFTFKREELIGDLLNSERGDPRRESSTAHEHWYSEKTRHKFGAWGPEQRRYIKLPGVDEKPVEWKRERVLAVGSRFIGYEYQHHHVPDWDPPQHWPWKHCCAGHNGRGVDCSNFTTFVYNQGFGIHMSSGIERQSVVHEALEGRHEWVTVHKIELPAGFKERQETLRTGDLLYIRGREEGPVTHVITWVGSIGRSPSGVPLVIDSHGGDVRDDDGKLIPCGIHLRPYREDSWYNKCVSHAHRIFVG
jgi:cell wall-associated NlpC family hydrolase